MSKINGKMLFQKKCPAPSSKLGKSKTSKEYNTSLMAQRQRVLQHLQSGKSLTTQQARLDLDIMHPGGRISELKKHGWNIKMDWVCIDSGKATHRIEQYYLSSKKLEVIDVNS